MKVERFSYPVPTPSAVRGIFDAIYCKPMEFRWQVTKIEILNPIQYIALRRNEVKGKAPGERVIRQWAKTCSYAPLIADGDEETKGRTQRQTMALKDVAYRVHAHVRPWLGHDDELNGIENQFLRRAEHGKCFVQPCFGCREFPAYFEPVIHETEPAPTPLTQDLGWMVYDVFDLSRTNDKFAPTFVSLFNARMQDGVVAVPPFEDDAVRKPEGGATC
jgi:CRISPR-associated protein Cas5d